MVRDVVVVTGIGGIGTGCTGCDLRVDGGAIAAMHIDPVALGAP